MQLWYCYHSLHCVARHQAFDLWHINARSTSWVDARRFSSLSPNTLSSYTQFQRINVKVKDFNSNQTDSGAWWWLRASTPRTLCQPHPARRSHGPGTWTQVSLSNNPIFFLWEKEFSVSAEYPCKLSPRSYPTWAAEKERQQKVITRYCIDMNDKPQSDVWVQSWIFGLRPSLKSDEEPPHQTHTTNF